MRRHFKPSDWLTTGKRSIYSSSILARSCQIGNCRRLHHARIFLSHNDSRSILRSETRSRPSLSPQTARDIQLMGNKTLSWTLTNDEARDSIFEYDDAGTPLIAETWRDAVYAVVEATRQAYPNSPPFDTASPGEFQSYWRSVLNHAYESVMANPGIPEKLSQPPVKRFAITLFDQQTNLRCPCCHADVEPNIWLENENGVTKGDLVSGIANYLYGETLPVVYEEDEEDYEDHTNPASLHKVEGRVGALVYEVNWMLAAGKHDSDVAYGYVRYGHESDIPAMAIWLYCCPWESFSGEVEEADRERQHQDSQAKK